MAFAPFFTNSWQASGINMGRGSSPDMATVFWRVREFNKIDVAKRAIY